MIKINVEYKIWAKSIQHISWIPMAMYILQLNFQLKKKTEHFCDRLEKKYNRQREGKEKTKKLRK